MTQPGCTKMAVSQLSLVVASSNLVGRKSKCYFTIKFSLLLSVTNSCAADEQACVNLVTLSLTLF